MSLLAQSRIAVTMLLFVALAASCSKKKSEAIVDAGVESDAGVEINNDALTPAAMKARAMAGCGAPDRCKCIQERLTGRYTEDALSVMSPQALATLETETNEECTLRSGKLRDGVLSTCMDGDEASRAICVCATDAFLGEMSASVLMEIMSRGWDRDTTNALLFEKAQCSKKPG